MLAQKEPPVHTAALHAAKMVPCCVPLCCSPRLCYTPGGYRSSFRPSETELPPGPVSVTALGLALAPALPPKRLALAGTLAAYDVVRWLLSL